MRYRAQTRKASYGGADVEGPSREERPCSGNCIREALLSLTPSQFLIFVPLSSAHGVARGGDCPRLLRRQRTRSVARVGLRRPGKRGMQEEVAADPVSLGATMSDSLSFMTDTISEEVKKEIGHQVVETIPLCFFNGVPCNATELPPASSPLQVTRRMSLQGFQIVRGPIAG